MKEPRLKNRRGPPITVGAALLGLFGNDGIQYGPDGTGHIEANQTFSKWAIPRFKRDH